MKKTKISLMSKMNLIKNEKAFQNGMELHKLKIKINFRS